jgi:ABC-type lipoprotein release transport system permease subunit
MKEFFGIDMTYIMIALVAILFVALATIGYVFVRNRVMFQVGVRNIPRRRAQTILIVIGLMLSTLIISTALSIGDTVEYSLTKTIFSELQSVDQVVSARTNAGLEDPDNGVDESEAFGAFDSISSPLPMARSQADEFVGQFRGVDNVDGVMPLIRGAVAVQNVTRGQTEPFAVVVGLPDDIAGFESDLETIDGELYAPADLAPGELLASKTAAKELAIEAGDKLTLFANTQPSDFTVKAVVEDRFVTGSVFGATFGFAMPFEQARELFGREDEVDFIVVSNTGGVRDSLRYSEGVAGELNQILSGTPWQAHETKQTLVELSSESASFFTTFFFVLGLFSIAAGMLLIFLIFVMLAAERKVEMGMMRAVGTKRNHLVQMFMSEGMVYNVTAAAIGCALGIGVAVIMVQVMARLFAEFGLQVSFHVTAQSLIIAYSIGVVLTFLTVTFSSWRIGNLNIVSAIRDSADPAMRKEPPRGSGIGFVVRYVAWVLFKPESWGQFWRSIALVPVGAVMTAAGVGLFMAAAAVYGSGTAGGALGVLFGVLGGFVIFGGVALIFIGLSSIVQWGPLMLIAGPILVLLGLDSNQAFTFGAGFSMIIVGAALQVTFLGFPARPAFTTMGLAMLVFWLLFAGGNTPSETINRLDGDIEMFFLSGVTMVIAGTFVLVYNADLLLGLVTLFGGFFSSLVPSIKTAVAYPLANKFRTGMTIAMISLVMFALVMMSTMNENFDRLFLSDDALAGYDVLVSELPGNPIDDVAAQLDVAEAPAGSDAGGPTGPELAGRIINDDRVMIANGAISKLTQLNVEKPAASSYSIQGMSEGFLRNNLLTFQTRMEGLTTNEEVRAALASNPNYAIIDRFATEGDFGGMAVIEGIDTTDRTMEPIPVEILDSATGRTRRVEIIAVTSTVASGLFQGLYVSEDAFLDTYRAPDSSLHYLQITEEADANETAQGIERMLLSRGVQANSLRQQVDDYQAQSRGFLYLLQGFMGIGLFVGIAAVGVIAFRTVVERRQQIGMLRAIGYTRRAVALSFLMESSFTALLGIGSGITLGLLLAYQLASTDEFASGGVTSFYIPWVQILAIGGFAFIASLVMTIIPSRQASGIPIAEALRYE